MEMMVASKPLEQMEIGQMPKDDVGTKILWLLIGFVLPLALLTIADRIWMWSQWVRKKNPMRLKKTENNDNLTQQP